MPIDASIPLQVRPPQFEDPTQAYGRMLSLRNLQQESQQRQQLAPLVYQQQAAAAQAAQIQVSQMQRAQHDQELWSNELRSAANPAPAAAAAPAQPASTPPPASQASQPKPEQGASAGPAGPADDADEPVAPKPAAQAPPLATAQPVAHSAAPPVDMLDVANRALAKGMSYGAYSQITKGIIDHREQLAKMDSAEREDTDKRHDALLGRLAAFRKQPAQYQQDNWGKFLDQAYSDKILNAPEYSAIVKQHPDLPDTLDSYQLSMQGLSGQFKAAEAQSRLDAEKARQAQEASAKAKADAELPGVQAKADEEQRSMWGAKLAAQTTSAGYAATLDEMKTAAPKYATEAERIAPREQWNAAKTPGLMRTWAQNTEQQVRSAESASREKQTIAHQTELASLMAERNDMARQRADRETGPQHKAYINNLAEEAYLRSGRDDATGSPDPTKATYDRAIADVQNPNLYSDHPIGDVRGEVADALRAKQGGGLRNQRTQGQIDKDGDLEKFLMGGQTPTAKPGTGRSTPPATTQKAAPPAAQAKPAEQQMTEADARAKAIAAGKDADWYVGELRKRKLLK